MEELILSSPFINHSFVGGVLIGVAALILLAGIGRVAGVSGIVGGLMKPQAGEVKWRVAFLAGLIGGAFLIRQFYPYTQPPFFFMPIGYYVIAGFLVGFGTRMGGGCTSGHGVCGLPRLSVRSFAAVMTFMATAMLTVYFFHRSGGAS